MGNNIWQIVAFHGRKEEYVDRIVELEKKLGIVALGWYDSGNLKGKDLNDKEIKAKIQKKLKKQYDNWKSASRSLRTFIEKVRIGDLIILYKKRNMIASIGKVTGPYKFRKNEVGRKSYEGPGWPVWRNGRFTDFGYPHQRKVSWLERPINFSRDHLSKFTGIGTQGTIHRVSGGSPKELLYALKKIPKTTETPVDERKIKGYLRQFIGKKVSWLERGLKLIKAEPSAGHGRADFSADKGGKSVMIEVKTSANRAAVTQLEYYMKKSNAKIGILLANSFNESCKKDVKQSSKIIKCFSCKSVTAGKWVAMDFTTV